MNVRPTPHIGATLAQQRAILLYRMQQRELEAERFERTTAALQVDALLDRIREHDASGCAECEDAPEVPDVPPPAPTWLAWAAMVALSIVLTAGALAFAIWLPRIWEAMA